MLTHNWFSIVIASLHSKLSNRLGRVDKGDLQSAEHLIQGSAEGATVANDEELAWLEPFEIERSGRRPWDHRFILDGVFLIGRTPVALA